MVRWPTSRRRLSPLEAHLGQIEHVDKHIDHANRVAQWNHRGIRAIMSFALDPPLQRSASSIPPQNHGSQQQHSAFTQPGSIASLRASVGHFRSIPHDSRAACLKGAISRRISRFHCCE
jgi:hypothetical protein